MKPVLSEVFTVRKRGDLPFYCRPVELFISVWLVMLGCFLMQFSYSSYPETSMAWLLFASSVGSLLLGYFIVRLISLVVRPPRIALQYQIDLTRLRRIQWGLFAIALPIITLNLVSAGLPPLFGFFGSDTLSYMEYGKLKQLLNAATMAIFVTASLESSKSRKLLMYGFPILCMLAYVTRGYLLFMLFQGLVVFSLRTKLSKRKLYLIALCCLVIAAVAANIIGNGRSAASATELFVAFFNVKPFYADWPKTFLWIASYIGIPVSNLCWIVHVYHYRGPSTNFLATLLPSFWAPPSLEWGNLGSIDIIDGVHTYLAKYYIDLWFVGIFIINFIWGIISGYLISFNRLASRYLTSSVLLAAIAFIFFADYLTMIGVLMELFILALIHRYITRPVLEMS